MARTELLQTSRPTLPSIEAFQEGCCDNHLAPGETPLSSVTRWDADWVVVGCEKDHDWGEREFLARWGGEGDGVEGGGEERS